MPAIENQRSGAVLALRDLKSMYMLVVPRKADEIGMRAANITIA